MKPNSRPGNIDEYIALYPENIRKKLNEIRAVIKNVAPDAAEAMKYGIPTFVLSGNLVHFAGFENHIGFYPAPSGIKAFQKDLKGFKFAKGSVQFPIDEPMPIETITKIVRFRVKENLEISKLKKKS